MYKRLIKIISEYGQKLETDGKVERDVYEIGNHTFKCGLYTISSPTGGGKSMLAQDIRSRTNGILIDYMEPVSTAAISLDEIATRLNEPQEKLSNVIIIDSLRTFQYKGDGAAVSGGVSSDFWDLLTVLTILALRHRMLIFVVVNPMIHENKVKQDAYNAALESSTTGIIFGTSETGWHIKTRDRDRKKTDFDISEEPRVKHEDLKSINLTHTSQNSYPHLFPTVSAVISELKKQDDSM